MQPVRLARLAKGMCIHCGKCKAANGPKKRCDKCLEVSRAYTKANRTKAALVREQRAAAGLCTYCGKSKATHGKRCTRCRDRDNAKHKEWLKREMAERKAKGMCKSCGKNAIAKRSVTRCNDCLSRESARLGARQVRSNAYARSYYQKLKLQVIDHYSDGTRACKCCGENELLFLSIDHVNNDGALHREVYGVKGGIPLFRFLIKNKFPAGFQILCFNCNHGKHLGGGICPHQKDVAVTKDGNTENCSRRCCKN